MSSSSTIGSWRHLNSSFLSRQLQMRIDLVNIFQMSASPLKSCRYTNLIVNWHEEGLNYAIRTLCASTFMF
jgi:hypothetical protein